MDEANSARSLRVGLVRGVCGVARLGRSAHYVLRRAPCIHSLAKSTRLTRNTQTGSQRLGFAVERCKITSVPSRQSQGAANVQDEN
jgi:hypothetical protein